MIKGAYEVKDLQFNKFIKSKYIKRLNLSQAIKGCLRPPEFGIAEMGDLIGQVVPKKELKLLIKTITNHVN